MKYGVRDTLSPMLAVTLRLQTKGELVGDEWHQWTKIWTSTAKYAQTCFVWFEPSLKRQHRDQLFTHSNGYTWIEVRPLVDMTLDAGFNEVFFTDVRIPAENIVGEGQGWLVANKPSFMKRVINQTR